MPSVSPQVLDESLNVTREKEEWSHDMKKCGRPLRAISKVSGLDVSGSNIFHNLYIRETYILY